jgi:hypothetical protein
MIVGGKPVTGAPEGVVEEEIADETAEDRLVGDEVKESKDRQSGDDRIQGFVNEGEDRQSGDDRIQGFDTSLDQSGDDR